jgi:hypothetical protein
LRKYSSLWIASRKTSDARPTAGATVRPSSTMAVFEARLPTTGTKPVTKVKMTSDVASGMW